MSICPFDFVGAKREKLMKADGQLTDLGPHDGGVYFYNISKGHHESMADIFKDYLGKTILIEEKTLKTKRKLIFTMKL